MDEEQTGRVHDPNRDMATINTALAKVGFTSGAIDRWWNSPTPEGLNGRTPLDVWQSGDYERVMRLAEVIVSEIFAARLAKSPEVIDRLLRAAER